MIFVALVCLTIPPRASGQELDEKAAKQKISELRKDFLRELKKLKKAYADADRNERADIIKARRELEATTVQQATEALKAITSEKLRISTIDWYFNQKVKGSAQDMLVDSIDETLTKSKYAYELAMALPKVAAANDKIVKLARQLVKNASTTKGKGISRFVLANVLSKTKLKDTQEVSQEIDNLLTECLEDYPRVKLDSEPLGRLAKRQMTARRLIVGRIAPDIEGVDLDDVSFKLSDYRGKVVVLDFWGDW